MIVNSVFGKVQSHGISETSSFGMVFNAKAFRVLSSTLYQDKIGSIVRELSCNAYDSHIVVGNQDVPFEIHLPDAFEPWFSIKDYGVGLSQEMVKTVFVVFFVSTKDQSNDFTGCFGLGSKSVFSYTDQFLVISVFDGTKTTYSAHITESGVPAISVMHSEKTTEPTGVEIKMSVRSSDYREFAKAVSEQLKFFVVKPRITNGDVVFKPEGKIVYEDENVKIIDTTEYSSSTVTILQGSVGYPLELSKIADKLSPDNHSFILNFARNGKLRTIIRFPIGEIGVTASREGVEYDDITCSNINSHLTIIREQVEQFVLQKMNSMKNEWEIGVALNTDSLLFNLSSSCKFKHLKKSSYKYSIYFGDFLNNSARLYTKGRKNDRHNCSSITCEENTTLVIRDSKSKSDIKINEYISNNPNSNVYIYVPDSSTKVDDAFIDSIKEALGGFDTILLTSKMQVSKNNISKVRSNVSQYYTPHRYLDSSFFKWKKNFTMIEDIDTPSVYILIDKMEFQPTSSIRTVYEMVETFNTLSKIIKVPNLIAIRAKDVKKANQNKNLQSFDSFVEKVKREIRADKSLVRNSTYRRLVVQNKMLISIAPFVTSGKLKNIVDFLKAAQTKITNTDQEAIAKLNFAKIPMKTSRAQSRISKYLESNPILKAYTEENYTLSDYMDEKTVVQYALAYEQLNQI